MFYNELEKILPPIFEGENRWLPNSSNFSAFIFNYIYNLNWAGFYFFDGTNLIVGPFQGKPACVEINPNKGVCGKSFSEKSIIIVDNVDEFPGHIACDANSKSEIVFPLIINDKIIGVFDIDSPNLSRFNQNDSENIQNLINIFIKHTNFDNFRL